MSVDAAVLGGPPSASRKVTGPVRRAVDIATTILSVLFAIVGTLTLVLAVATHVAGSSFSVAGHPVMVVLSGSMAPAIDTGDIVIDRRLSADEAAHLQVGQIVSFRPSSGDLSTPITHRIHALTSVGGQLMYITKGDANNAPDSAPVLPSQILGVYDSRIPDAGYILNGLRQPLTLGLLLAAPLLWLLSGLLFQWAREADAPPDAPQTSDDARGQAR